jgi:rhodanese-related sulfurtransferase
MQQLGQFIINNWELFLALLIIIGLLLGQGFSDRVLGFKELQPAEVTQQINRHSATVLDVREEEDFKLGHIVNAVHAPLSTLETRWKSLEKFKGKPIVVTCQKGDRAARAAALLRKQGFDPVYKLAGGLLAWREAKLPLVSK